MPQLPAWSGRLAVQMEVGAGHAQHALHRGQLADEVNHRAHATRRGATQRIAQNGAQVILKLTGLRAFDAPVSAVMHARRHFVRQQLLTHLKQLQRHHAHIVQRFEQPCDVSSSGGLQRTRVVACRRQRETQNALPMMILHEGIDRHLA
jgi:hypothetical protein